MTSRCAALFLLPALLLAACGGGSDSGDAASPTASATSAGLAKAEYLTKSEAVCTKANTVVDAQTEPTSGEEAVAQYDASLTLADTTTTELEELAADQPDAAQLQTIFLTPVRGQVAALTAYKPTVEKAAAEGPEAFDALAGPDLPEADLAAMKTYGFSACVTLAETS